MPRCSWLVLFWSLSLSKTGALEVWRCSGGSKLRRAVELYTRRLTIPPSTHRPLPRLALPHPHKTSINHWNTSSGHSPAFREGPCFLMCDFPCSLSSCPSLQLHPFLQSTLILPLLLMCLLARPHYDLFCFCHLALGPNQFCCCWMINKSATESVTCYSLS